MKATGRNSRREPDSPAKRYCYAKPSGAQNETKFLMMLGRFASSRNRYLPSSTRNRLAKAWSSFQAMALFFSISGRNSQNVSP
jgi:hypothetical protein